MGGGSTKTDYWPLINTDERGCPATGACICVHPCSSAAKLFLILLRDDTNVMYWDVVEVKAEPDYSLLVRFKDGLAGRVQLRAEGLTGVLAPLLEARFFEQAFIDDGAVAWPGEIELAPDAMYAQVANQRCEPYEVRA
jgi:hypothetical protein